LAIYLTEKEEMCELFDHGFTVDRHFVGGHGSGAGTADSPGIAADFAVSSGANEER